MQPMEVSHQIGGTVGHCRVDDLPFAARARMNDAGEQADNQEQGAAAVIRGEIERWNGFILGADGMQRAAERQIVDVMSGISGVRTGLAPAGHAAIKDARIALEYHVRTEAESFHDPGAIALDKDLRMFAKPKAHVDGVRLLEIQFDGQPTASVQTFRGGIPRTLSLDTQDV